MAALDGVTPAIIGAANVVAASDLQVDRSLRFNDGDSPSLSKTFSSNGNRKKWTWSCWFKLGALDQPGRFLGAGSSATERTNIFYHSSAGSSGIAFYSQVGGFTEAQGNTNSVFRDPSAWYHLVFVFDCANSTNDDRVKIYINGVEQTITFNAHPTNIDHYIGGNVQHVVGRGTDGYSFDGYLAECHYVNGQILTPSDFGAYDANNIWQPKAYTGSYGTNGFYLKFADNSSNAALGTDSSGSGHTFTVNNLVAGPTTHAVAGNHGGKDGISFNGTNAVVNLSSSTDVNPGSGEFTFECYAYSNSSTSEFGIYDGSPGGNGSLVIRRVGAGTLMVERHNQAFDITGAAFSQNTWHHVAVTRDSSNNVRLFVDGNQSGSTSTSNTHNYSGLFRLGQTNNTFTNGYISNLRLIKGTALYTSNFTPPTGNLGNVTNTKLLMAQSTTSAIAATVKPDDVTITAPGDYSVVDSVLDSPTNYTNGTVGGNYPTFNPLSWALSTNGGVSNGALLSDGNLKSDGNSAWASAIATMAIPNTGKWYFEFTCLGGNTNIGLFKPVYNYNGTIRDSTESKASWYGFNGYIYHWVTGYVTDATVATYTTNDIIGIAVDSDAFTVRYYKNNTLQYTQTLVAALQTELSAGNLYPGVDTYAGVDCTVNFGQQGFNYTPPTNYNALCAQNLSDPAILDGSTAFDIQTYNGTGASQTLGGLSFAADLFWRKCRSTSQFHNLVDSVRGLSNALITNGTYTEQTGQSNVSNVTSTGYDIGTEGAINTNSETYVAWLWDMGTSTETNNDGSVTASVRANASAGQSIVSVDSIDSTNTIRTAGHGLNATPQFIISKNRDFADNWFCYHKDVQTNNRQQLRLNTTDATITSGSDLWAHTSSVIGFNGALYVASGTDNLIFYCFAPVEGFSKFGFYGGSGLTEGPFINTGFRPRWILLKRTDGGSENWVVYDTARNTQNVMGKQLYPNLSNAEADAGTNPSYAILDSVSNGFKIRGSHSSFNGSGQTFVYAAFAENPLKIARAR